MVEGLDAAAFAKVYHEVMDAALERMQKGSLGEDKEREMATNLKFLHASLTDIAAGQRARPAQKGVTPKRAGKGKRAPVEIVRVL